MTDKKTENTPARPHSLILDGRKKAQLTGVNKVVSATASRITLDTSMGGLLIEGADLAISKFSDSDGTLAFEGSVSLIKYVAAPTSMVKRFFK